MRRDGLFLLPFRGAIGLVDSTERHNVRGVEFCRLLKELRINALAPIKIAPRARDRSWSRRPRQLPQMA